MIERSGRNRVRVDMLDDPRGVGPKMPGVVAERLDDSGKWLPSKSFRLRWDELDGVIQGLVRLQLEHDGGRS